MTNKIDTFHYRAWHLVLLRQGKDRNAQNQVNMTEWEMRSWCQWLSLSLGQHYEVSTSVYCHKLVLSPNLESKTRLAGRLILTELWQCHAVLDQDDKSEACK